MHLKEYIKLISFGPSNSRIGTKIPQGIPSSKMLKQNNVLVYETVVLGVTKNNLKLVNKAF